QSLFNAGGNAAWRLRDFEFVEQFAKALAVFCEVDRFGRSSDDRHASSFQRQREIERRLPAKLDNHPNCGTAGTLMIENCEHILISQRLEVEAIAGVVVGGDGLRIAVDHDGFVAIFTQRESGVASAVIKFDSLPD